MNDARVLPLLFPELFSFFLKSDFAVKRNDRSISFTFDTSVLQCTPHYNGNGQTIVHFSIADVSAPSFTILMALSIYGSSDVTAVTNDVNRLLA